MAGTAPNRKRTRALAEETKNSRNRRVGKIRRIGTDTPQSENAIMTRFRCAECGFAYSVVRRTEPSGHEPHCERCDAPLPDDNGGDWLHYTAVSGQSGAPEGVAPRFDA